MVDVDVRSLQEDPAAALAAVAAGENVTITDHGVPIAVMIPPPPTRLGQLLAAGLARPPRRDLAHLPAPEPGPALSAALAADRRSTPAAGGHAP